MEEFNSHFWQVYQLDFGGRVTQESAKNFQIEYQGKQVGGFFVVFFTVSGTHCIVNCTVY